MDNKFITILQHRIEYWYDDDQNMPEWEEEHVKKLIEGGYIEGQLVDSDPETDEDNTGYWKINNNPDN